MARKKKENEVFNLDDYKDEIDKYIKKRVEKEAASEVVKLYKKQISGLKIKNTIKNILIILLLAVIGYGSYLVYNGEAIAKNGKVVKKIDESTQEKENISKDANKNTKEKLIEENKYLLDKIIINDDFDYIDDLENGNITMKIKEAIAFSNLNSNDIENNDGTLVISEDKIIEKINELFTSCNDLETFKYNGKTFTYLKNQKIFVGEEPDVKETLSRNITDIEVNRNIITFTVSENINKEKTINLKYVFVDSKLDKIEKVD